MNKCVFFIIICLLWAQDSAFIDAYIKDRPKGIVRDFYIWQYLNNHNPDASELEYLYPLLSAKNPYLKRVLQNLSKTTALPKELQCASMPLKNAIQTDTPCFEQAVKNKLADAKTLGTKERNKALELTKDTTLKNALALLFAKDYLTKLTQANAAVFALVYPTLSLSEKQKLKITPHDFEQLFTQKSNAFFNLINAAAHSKTSPLKPLLLNSDITAAPHNTLFLLGLNELRFGSKQKALTYFERTKNATTSSFFRDRALLWQYLVSDDKHYLQQLAKSKNVNIFSLYALELLGLQPEFTIQHKLPNLSSNTPPFDPNNPYQWQEIAHAISIADPKDLQAMIPHFSYQNTEAQLVYLLNRIEKFQNHYFIIPHQAESIEWKNPEEYSLALSIARQESLFLPALISRSFALGMMQIMPANITPFAREMGLKHITYDSLFEPKTALEMGKFYLSKLQKEYQHPLFVAYAYNGGPTFLRKLLAKRELFRKKQNIFEPWLSMELIPYEETRLYGMRVLANYVVYQKYFKRPISIKSLLEQTMIY